MSSEVMTTNKLPEMNRTPENEAHLDELARKKGVKPVKNVHDMARPELFDSDEEADEFLVWLREQRWGNLA
jgi:hypothetical protein